MITVNIPEGVKEVTASTLYQWDYGQILRITGDNLPALCEVHFCDRTCKEAIKRIASPVEDGLEVAIPDALLENKWPINAFIYVCEGECGQTIKKIHIPVIERKKPTSFEPIPEDLRTELDEMIANVNAMTEKAEEFYSQGITGEELIEIIREESSVAQLIQRDIVQPPVNGKEVTNSYSVEIDDEGNLYYKEVDRQGAEPMTKKKALATKNENEAKTGAGSVTISNAGVYLVKSTLGDMIIHIPNITKSAVSTRIITSVDFTNNECKYASAVFTPSTKVIQIVEASGEGVIVSQVEISVIALSKYE